MRPLDRLGEARVRAPDLVRSAGDGRGCAKLPGSGMRGRLVRAEEQCKNNARQNVQLGERRTIIDNRAMPIAPCWMG